MPRNEELVCAEIPGMDCGAPCSWHVCPHTCPQYICLHTGKVMHLLSSPPGPRFYQVRAIAPLLRRPADHLALNLPRAGGWKDSLGPHLFPAITVSSFRVVMLSLEFDYMCQYDYVEVRDGDSSDSQIIKRFCGNERPAPIQSTGSSLHILFHSDGSKNFDGFHAIFEEITGEGQREKD